MSAEGTVGRALLGLQAVLRGVLESSVVVAWPQHSLERCWGEVAVGFLSPHGAG